MAGLIVIRGQVTNALGGLSVPGTRVVALREGTEIQQEVDNEGNYVLHLVPGVWRIAVWPKGFIEPEPYRYNFASDTDGIDFRLQEGYSVSGMAIKEEDLKPAPGVVVQAATNIGGQDIVKQALTGDDGRFRLSGLPPGRWQVKGTAGESHTGAKVLELGPDVRDLHLTLSRQMTRADWQWGVVFISALAVLLVALAAVYLWTHKRYTSGPEPELAALIGQVEQTRTSAAKLQGTEKVPEASALRLRDAVSALKENWAGISPLNTSLTAGQHEQADVLLSTAGNAVTTGDFEEVALTLATLRSVFENERSSYFWAQSPESYLEVLFWSLAGILVSLLISSGYYLRRKRFYREGVWMHLSHLLSVPLLALVVVFLLSQIKLTAQIGGSELTLDVTDPRLLAAISFIIAVRPWGMLTFVREAGNQFLGQVQRRIAGPGDVQSQPETT